jgi:hypothetical protein
MHYAVWFSASFTIVCGLLTFALASGLVAPEIDASITGLLTVIGALLFIANLAPKRVFLR